MQCLRNVFVLLVGSIFLLWPSIFNGQLFFFPDSTNYVKAGVTAVEKFTGGYHTSEWTKPKSLNNKYTPIKQENGSKLTIVSLSKGVNDIDSGVVMAGRSPYFGTLIYVTDILTNFWGYALIQASLTFYLILLVLRLLKVSTRQNILISLAVVSFLTPASFYNSYVLVDTFAAFGLLSFAILATFFTKLLKLDKFMLFSLMVLSTTSHLTHLVMILLLLILIGMMSIFFRNIYESSKYALLTGILSVVIGIVSILVTNIVIEKSFGAPPLQVPMLTARFIEDGPGYLYIQNNCDKSEFIICEFQDQLPLDSQSFLWDINPQTSIFYNADIRTKRLMAKQDKVFASYVFLEHPWLVIKSMTANTVEQLFDLSMLNFNYQDPYKRHFENKLPTDKFEKMLSSLSYNNKWPIDSISLIVYLSTLFSMSILMAYYLRRKQTKYTNEALHAFDGIVIIVVLGLVINAFICGAGSEPQARYTTRMIWLIPFLATVAALLFRKHHQLARLVTENRFAAGAPIVHLRP
ncbi:MAG: hypothetical protein ACI9Y1_003124 [Lentisphaeria bacterium]|jgi:hypothetical protein